MIITLNRFSSEIYSEYCEEDLIDRNILFFII